MNKLSTFYHPDVTIFEGGGVNNGWIDYRDRHLGPELCEGESVEDQRIRELCKTIVWGQQAEIDQMRALLQEVLGAR